MAHQARFLAISNMAFHHNLSTIFGGWVPRTIMAYRHMNFCGFQNHCEPDLRISSHIPYLIALYYYCRDSEYLTMKHATYILPRKFGWTFLKHLNEFDPLFYSTITYVYQKKKNSRKTPIILLVLEMIVENSEFMNTLHKFIHAVL